MGIHKEPASKPSTRKGKLIPNAVTRYRNAHGDWTFTAHRPDDAGPSSYRAVGSNKARWDVYDSGGELLGVFPTLADVRGAIFNCEI